jgi:hypothetical protein
MAFKDQDHCAARGCVKPCAGWATLCAEHMVPGMAVTGETGTCVVTSWYAEHAGRRGIIFLNDFALGDLFGGAKNFSAELRSQGFCAIRLLRTPDEVEAAKWKVAGAPGNWSGPWRTEYSWEVGTRGHR